MSSTDNNEHTMYNPELNYTDADRQFIKMLQQGDSSPLTEIELSGMNIQEMIELWRKKEVFHTALKMDYLDEQVCPVLQKCLSHLFEMDLFNITGEK